MRILDSVNSHIIYAIDDLISESEPSDLDVGDQFGRTPLMFCVLADRLECAELLLKARSHINIRDKGGRTALHWAAHKVPVQVANDL